MFPNGFSIRQLRRLVVVVVLLVLTLTVILVYRQTVHSDGVELFVKHSHKWHVMHNAREFEGSKLMSSEPGHHDVDDDDSFHSIVTTSKKGRSRRRDKRRRPERYRSDSSRDANQPNEDSVGGNMVSGSVQVERGGTGDKSVKLTAVDMTNDNQQNTPNARQNIPGTVLKVEVFNDELDKEKTQGSQDSENNKLFQQTAVDNEIIHSKLNATESAGRNSSKSSIVGNSILPVELLHVRSGTVSSVIESHENIWRTLPDARVNLPINAGKVFSEKMAPDLDNSAVQRPTSVSHTTTMVLPAEDIEDSKEVLLSSGKKPSGSFFTDLQLVADFNGRLVISVVDSGYVPMAVNFYRISVKSVGLKNFLMTCTDKEAVELLRQHGIACSLYLVPPLPPPAAKREKLLRRNNSRISSSGPDGRQRSVSLLNGEVAEGVNAKQASDFGTYGYYQKSNVKTSLVMEVLRLGYTVLVIDVDVVLFKDPFPYFNCTECDIHFSMDREMFNSGFAYIRPTVGSKQLYQTAWDLYTKYQKAHDQVYINMAITRLNLQRHATRMPVVQIRALPVQQFPCGAYYFARDHRMFENLPPCPNCVMAHNNYIGSAPAKIYRFKENLLWTLDDNMYYSNKSARYFTYDNPYDFGSDTVRMETEALKSALAVAMTTGRLLILPTFRCCAVNCQTPNPHQVIMPGVGNLRKSGLECSDPRHRCSLLSILRLTKFNRAFSNYYREHSFLGNRFVPKSIKQGVSKFPIFINSSDSVSVKLRASLNVSNHVIVTPVNQKQGASLTEVVRWFDEHADETVIRFHSLYGTSVDWQSDKTPLGFKLKKYFEVGFECSEYEQWDSSLLNLSKMWPGN